MKSRLIIAAGFLTWVVIILSAFFVVQRPVAIIAIRGLTSLSGTILLAILFVSAGAGIGYFLLSRLKLEPVPSQRFIFSAGLGVGFLGLLGFGLAVFGLANAWVLVGLLIGILLWSRWMRLTSSAAEDLRSLWAQVTESVLSVPAWIRWFAFAFAFFSFLLALAPPIEAFDGLFYHLTVPSLWLQHGGLELMNMPHYWYPSLMESMFLWPLSLGLDSTPQLIHFAFGILCILLVLAWTHRLFGKRAAGWSIAIFLSMPSLPWLAAWAYTDLGLIFYSLGALFALSNWRESSNDRWLMLAGLMAGFAMGIKYTSFVLPLVIILLLIGWKRHDLRGLALSLLMFSGAALAAAFPWYLRNWIWMGNPFYPFVFGGPFWDGFRARWYSGAGTGIGWNLPEIFSLPLVTTLGVRDVNYSDGRIGPLYLVLLPLALWALWKRWKQQEPQRPSLAILCLFFLASALFWVLGVIQTDYLAQARLLWPGLIPLIPLMAVGITELDALDSSRLRLSFVFSVLAALTIFSSLLDFALLVAFRNPVMAAIGSETRQSYTARLQPKYAQALELVEQTRPDAYVYLLNEPRSYGMDRHVQPDAINDNLAHDFHIYKTNAELLAAWRSQGYTHVLASREVFAPDNQLVNELVPDYQVRLKELIGKLTKVGESSRGDYILFTIPQP